MKTANLFKRVVAVALCAALLCTALPMTAFASISFDSTVSNGYYSVISKNEYTLAPGATETEMILNNTDGSRRQIVHVMEVDPKNDNLMVLPGYYGIDKLDPENLSDNTYWTDKQLTQTVAYYEDTLGYNVVGAMNTALAYDSNAPYGYMVYEGVQLGSPEVHKNAQTYLAIDWDGNCELRSMATPLTGNERTAIPANFGWLVKDGELVTKTVERTTSPASRSMIGIKADGTLVFCQVDGRIAPAAVGLSNYEMGEMMLSLGCVNAVNCDGGGSSTFVTKREGEEEGTMRSIPSDGSERPTINSVVIVSNAVPSGIFDHAVLDTEYDYYAAGAKATLTAVGVDTNGYPVDIPADGITWSLSDDSFGTVENGVFVSNGKLGDVALQMVYAGNVVGEKLIHVVHPEVYAFTVSETVIPYGKTIDVEFACTYGVDDWTVGVENAFELALSDDTAATLDGNKLTASSDESVTGVVVTATYKADTTKTATMKVSYGKGSEILYDFENNDLNGFVGFDEAKQWSIDNGVNNSLVGSSPLGGQYSDEVDAYTWIASADNGGQVKNGDHALAFTVDNTMANFAQWTYNVLFNVGGPVVLRDVANGKNAVALGMWLYIPEGAAGMAFQSQLFKKTATGYTHVQAHYTFTTADGTVKNLNSCTEADIPESRWVYAKVDLTGEYVSTADPTDTTSERSPSYLRTYVKPNYPQKITFYIDDITLDYSSAVEDRVLPTIKDVTYATADTAIELTENAAIAESEIAFSATVADNIALKYETGAILVDGKKLDGVTCTGKTLSSGNVTLSEGEHTVVFEVQDTIGNLAKIVRHFTVGTASMVTLSGHNDSGNAAEVGSLYYVDLTAADMASVEKLTAVLKLQTANNWELDAAQVASGFKADFDYNANSNLLTVTVEKAGVSIATFGRTAQPLVSIPVRVWSWDAISHVTGQPITPDEQYATGNCPVVTIDCEVVEGEVLYSDNTATTFGGTMSEATNINDQEATWHTHEPVAMDDVDPTCTTSGYSGRTYCEGCGSIVEAGTILPALGHDYDIVNREIVCHCGQLASANGLIEFEGKVYYAINGKLSTGWVFENNQYYYFGEDGAAYVGTHAIGQADEFYTFDENGVLVEGSWAQRDGQTVYHWAGNRIKRQFYVIDGKTYYFEYKGYMVTGIYAVETGSNSGAANFYLFGEDGAMVEEEGIAFAGEDIVYVKDGMLQYAGLVQDANGDYYYINSKLKAVKDCSYYVYTTNGYMPQGTYEFGPDGKMIIEKPDESKNGIFEEDGVLYLYVDGVKQQGLGLIEYDGAYYYVRTSGQLATGRYFISNGNGILENNKTYEFGADGKLFIEEVDESKNGILEENGALYLYIDGVKQQGLGLIEYEGAYYYVRTAGQLATGRYFISNGNGIIENNKTYEFGADGKLFIEEVDESKNGVLEENGVLYLYIDGVKQQGLGLVEYDGAYYYVRTSGQLATGRYFISYGNGILQDNKTYTFDTNGKLIVTAFTLAPSQAGAVKAGDTVYLNVYAASALDLNMIELHVQYDTTKLQATSAQAADALMLFDQYAVNPAPVDATGQIYVTGMAIDGVSLGADTLIATIAFDVLADADAAEFEGVVAHSANLDAYAYHTVCTTL